MLALYFGALLVFSANTVLSGPARLNEARDVLESTLSPRTFYWQCPQGQYFAGNAPPSSNPGSCRNCKSGTFSPDGVNCYVTPMGFYNDKGGAFNPIGCLAGTYTDSTGSKVCQPCASPLISYAASTKCLPCADGTVSTDAQYCHACPAGQTSTGGSACTAISYHILIRDASDKKHLGYLSMNEEPSLGVYYITNLADALTITSPTLGSSGPIPLVATTKSGTSGYNLAIGLGEYGDVFSATSTSYVAITESQSDTKSEYFASDGDWPAQKAEPNVWVLGSADAKDRIPMSLNFVGPNQSTVTCARFFDYKLTSKFPLLGATCATIGVYPQFDTSVLLFLVVA